MGELLLVLEDTADALATIDGEAARHFRMANGLPERSDQEFRPSMGALHVGDAQGRGQDHDISMTVEDDQISADCSCGNWSTVLGWDQIEELVVLVRGHIGVARSTTADGLVAGEWPDPSVETEAS